MRRVILRLLKKRNRSGTIVDFKNLNATQNDKMILEDKVFSTTYLKKENHSNVEDDNELIKCFLNLPTLDDLPNPISLQNIMNHQQ